MMICDYCGHKIYPGDLTYDFRPVYDCVVCEDCLMDWAKEQAKEYLKEFKNEEEVHIRP